MMFFDCGINIGLVGLWECGPGFAGKGVNALKGLS